MGLLRVLLCSVMLGLSLPAAAVEKIDSKAADAVQIKGVFHRTGYLGPQAGGIQGSATYVAPTAAEIAALPESYDARSENLVTPIKNQGNCGSCWSFSRTKAFEAALIKAGHPVALDLAEQDALVNDRSASGCGGGYMDGDFEVDAGVTTEALCPYRASGRYSCRGEKYAKAVKWTMIGGNRRPSVDELRFAVKKYGVLSVTVAAGGGFSPNSQGRILSCGSRSINHMVTLVAYRPAAEGGTEFLIANSWGTSWGQGGYAWSKQGCNMLASEAGDAALAYEVEPNTPPPACDEQFAAVMSAKEGLAAAEKALAECRAGAK